MLTPDFPISGFSDPYTFNAYSGRSGYSGGSGYSGVTGYSGAAPISGYSGNSGVSGFSGFVGIGTSGYSGANSTSGFSGASGLSGFSGKSGFSGVNPSGFSGVSGFSGRSGFSGASSDIRLKRQIRPFSDGLEVLGRVRPVRYKWNGLGFGPDDGREVVGVIGQELESVAPYAVVRSADPATGGEVVQIDTVPLIMLLANSLKELRRQLEELEG